MNKNLKIYEINVEGGELLSLNLFIEKILGLNIVYMEWLIVVYENNQER